MPRFYQRVFVTKFLTVLGSVLIAAAVTSGLNATGTAAATESTVPDGGGHGWIGTPTSGVPAP